LQPTARYEIRFLPSVRKDLRSIPRPAVRRILAAIGQLAEHPRPPGSKKLTSLDLYRIRVGVYRIVYEIHDRELVIAAVKVGHRREAVCG
jgi:mRNA interferase RelE/StbE